MQHPRNTPQSPPAGHRRRRISTVKVLRLALPVCLLAFMWAVMCTPAQPRGTAPAHTTGTPSAATACEPVKTLCPHTPKAKDVNDLERADTVTPWLARLDKMPEPTQRIKVNYFGNLRPYFNDSNHVHWQAARSIGIDPLTDTRSHWSVSRPLVKVTTCRDLWLDTLVYSRPYLVPEAAAALREIGRRFRDTIDARGGGDYRIKVTSLLRTPLTVKRLRRRNRNAIDSSVHQLGTTFDISYAQYVASSATPARSVDDLKGILAEVLKAMREEGKIYVKYEVGQPCFHITARPTQDFKR